MNNASCSACAMRATAASGNARAVLSLSGPEGGLTRSRGRRGAPCGIHAVVARPHAPLRRGYRTTRAAGSTRRSVGVMIAGRATTGASSSSHTEADMGLRFGDRRTRPRRPGRWRTNRAAAGGDRHARCQSGAPGGAGSPIWWTRFQQGDLGDVMSSWVGTGQNMPVSADQLGGVLGDDALAPLVSRRKAPAGGDLLGQLAQVLPPGGSTTSRRTASCRKPAAWTWAQCSGSCSAAEGQASVRLMAGLLRGAESATRSKRNAI